MNLFKTLLILLLFVAVSCSETNKKASDVALQTSENNSSTTSDKNSFTPSEDFKNYWYSGKAEITSYALEQARYGEIRKGHAVLVYVTEDFLPDAQVKADNYNADNIPVLKLNATKNFNTGIYPYSIMQSTFYPVSNLDHALKVTCSVQEWCGQAYTQLNNKSQFKIQSHSYFQSEGDQDFSLDKVILENELWTQLRIDPTSLPTGEFKMIPSLEFIRLKHIDLKAYEATAEISNDTYKISYPNLSRDLAISFNPDFPFNIVKWEETYTDGYGQNAKLLTTTAKKLKTLNSAYWSKNNNRDEVLRDSLKLK